jgi:hypothetical protein
MHPIPPCRIVFAAVTISTAAMLGTPAMASENNFVFVHRADSPGNDYLRVDHSSLEDCTRRCDAQNECNAFTYNRLHGVCFLKLSGNRLTTFYAFAITGIKLSPTVQPTAGASVTESSFVLLSQADSPGNDYSRVDNFSFENCRSRCDRDDACHAFTYNHARGVCFLKRSANQWTNFSAWATTGIKLSKPPKEKATSPAPAAPEAVVPSEQVEAPRLPTGQAPAVTPSEQVEAPRLPNKAAQPQVATPSTPTPEPPQTAPREGER